MCEEHEQHPPERVHPIEVLLPCLDERQVQGDRPRQQQNPRVERRAAGRSARSRKSRSEPYSVQAPAAASVEPRHNPPDDGQGRDPDDRDHARCRARLPARRRLRANSADARASVRGRAARAVGLGCDRHSTRLDGSAASAVARGVVHPLPRRAPAVDAGPEPGRGRAHAPRGARGRAHGAHRGLGRGARVRPAADVRAAHRRRSRSDRSGDPDPALRASRPSAEGLADDHRRVRAQRSDGCGARAGGRRRRPLRRRVAHATSAGLRRQPRDLDCHRRRLRCGSLRGRVEPKGWSSGGSRPRSR